MVLHARENVDDQYIVNRFISLLQPDLFTAKVPKRQLMLVSSKSHGPAPRLFHGQPACPPLNSPIHFRCQPNTTHLSDVHA